METIKKETKFDLICEELKKFEYKLNKDDEAKTNLFDAYIDGNSITNPYVQSVFRNVVKSIDKNIKVSFLPVYNYAAIININKYDA